MRIDKLLSQLKYGSRKEIAELISQNRIKVNGKTINKKDMDVNPNIDEIYVDNEKVFYQEYVYLAFNKPKGFLSANKDDLHPVLFSFIKEPYNRFDLKVCGRLDLDSEGLMILTNDGSFIHMITHPKTHLPKKYEVKLNREVCMNEVNQLLQGVFIKDGKNETYLAKALKLKCNKDTCYITIDEGKFHQVKRMFAFVNYDVIKLKRVQIGPLLLGDLKPGEHKVIGRELFYDGNYVDGV